MANSNAPDVRVRLSAEGVADVVNAFKRIQQEAERTKAAAEKAGAGAGFLNKQLVGLKEILPSLAIGAAVAGFVEMTKSALESAAALSKLEQKTGISVDTLSTYSFAAQQAHLDTEALEKGLVKFTRAMDDYDQGAGKAKDAVRQLFGIVNALKGLNEDERLRKVTDALARLEPGAKRTGLAITFFGKAGAELLPTLDQLGGQGFDELRRKAEQFGVAITKEGAEKAREAIHALEDLKLAAKGAANQFAQGLAPALADVVNGITQATTDQGVNGFETLGEIAGGVLRAIAAAIVVVGKTLGYVLSEGKNLISDWGNSWKDTIKGVWTEAKIMAGQVAGLGPFAFLNDKDWQRLTGQQKSAFMDRFRNFLAETNKEIDTIMGKGAHPKPKPTGKDNSRSTDLAEAEKARKAALDLAEAQADALAKIEAAEGKQLEALAKERYEQGLMSLRDYYAQRLAIVQKQGEAEAAALLGKVYALQSSPLGKDEQPAEREAKVTKAAAEYLAKVTEQQTQLNSLKADQAREEEALQQKALEFERKIQQAQGDRFAAAKAAIDAEAAQLDVILRKQGVGEAERQRRVQAFTASGYQQVDFSKLQNDARRAMDDLNADRLKIQNDVHGGLLFQFQGEQQIADLEQQRLPLLRAIAQQMLAAAVTPEQVQAAREFAQQLDQLAVNSNRAGQQMAQFRQDVSQVLTQDLSNWMSAGIDQAESLGDAFRGLALSVVQSLRQIASQMLATLMIQKLLGFMHLGMPGGGAPAPGHATGGLIRGPGAGTSDSIPARLSDYEYVVRSAVVRQPGVLEMLNTLNYGSPSVRRRGGVRFADGGLVDAAGSGQDAALSATLSLDEGLLLKRLEASPAFHRVIVRTAQSNKKAMNQALGR